MSPSSYSGIGGRAARVLLLVTLAAAPSAAVESGPQGIVRQFCQADALGRRITVRGAQQLMPIVSWSFEPAWDFVVLITGYDVGSPRRGEGDALEVDVHYNVVGQVSALGLETGVFIETVTFRVHAPEEGWRIIGPPVPPHIFATRVDIETTRRSFENGALNFLPNSLFIWQMFRSAGWPVPFQRTADLLTGTAYRPVEKAQVGDVVAYLRDGVAYHAGLLEAEDRVVSSTLNAGVVRTTIDGFPGEVRYLRLIEPEREPTSAVTPRRAAVAKARPTRKPAQPSATHRVDKADAVAPTPRPTPVASGTSP